MSVSVWSEIVVIIEYLNHDQLLALLAVTWHELLVVAETSSRQSPLYDLC
jgi:hypothetical protein